MQAPAIELPYRIVDVFTDTPLAGNALCVVLEPAAEPIMAALAREVNLSETTFVTIAGDASYDVRIWTPSSELPFAGHPSLGTAWVLGPGTWTQRSPGATVEITVDETGAVMSQPDPLFTEISPTDAAAALGIPEHAAPAAFVAEVGGTRHLLVPSDHPLEGVRPEVDALQAVARAVRVTGVGVFGAVDDDTLAARVFIPGSPVPEDPGTGSAAGAIALLGQRTFSTGVDVVVRQGEQMGRPCRIEVHAAPGEMRVGGRVTACAEGRFTLSPPGT